MMMMKARGPSLERILPPCHMLLLASSRCSNPTQVDSGGISLFLLMPAVLAAML